MFAGVYEKQLRIMKKIYIALLFSALFVASRDSLACTRAVYLGPNGTVITGRTMDWKTDIPTDLYIFPRGMSRSGADSGNTVHWTSRYGSLIASGYDMGTSEGINEKGLVVNLLYLPGTVYAKEGDTRPVMGISIWAQYVLDNFATVEQAVNKLSKEEFRIDAPAMPGGEKSTMHMAMSDPSGNSAILEYIDGELIIYQGSQYQVLTNAPAYNYQLVMNDYWQQIGGLRMLPGTNKAPDRFARASFYINAALKTDDPVTAVQTVFSVMRNVSVPLGISTPDSPEISSTRWRSISDQKNMVYYFEATESFGALWVNLKNIDFAPNAPVKKLDLSSGQKFTGDATARFAVSKPFKFLFELPSAQ